jgi:DNA-binding IclR family transcriptional regulator
MIKLTAHERAVLAAAFDQMGWSSGNSLARRTGKSLAGAHQTAASLVRKGLLERGRGNNLVIYRLTHAARDFKHLSDLGKRKEDDLTPDLGKS